MEKLDFSFRKKKRWLTLLSFCMMVLGGQMSFAQIDYTYDWEPTDMGGWTTSGSGSFSRQTVTPCSGNASARANNWYGNESFLVSPALTGTNGDDLTVSFNYKVTNYSNNSTGASAANFGEVRVEWASSTSGPWTVAYTITSADHIVSSSCANKSVTFSGLPSSGDVYVRFVAMSGNSSADNYAYFDDVVITQGPPPTCPAPTALTASNPTLTSIDLSWDGVGGASGNYEIKWGAPGFDIDSATAIPVTGLSYTLNGTGGSYEFVVREVCDINDESSWSAPYSFSIPNLGEDCSAPIVIGALPYTTTDDTANYTDNPNIEGSPGSSGCGTTSGYLGGNDVVYAYTAAFDGVIKVSMTPSGTWSGIFAYADCADIGTACIGGASNTGSAVNMFEMNVADGDTYYFVISTWASPQTVGYTLDISQVLCAKPVGVAHTDVTHNSANVSWDVSGDYEINWGTGTFTAGDGDNTDTVNNTTEFAFSGLNGTTTYRYFVRQNCGGTDGDSEWVGPFTFTTLLTPASIPWLEPFTGTTFPTGWANTSSWSVSTSTTFVPGAEGSYLYKNIFGTTGTNGVMFSTLRMGLVSAGDILNFNYGLRKYSATYTASGTISIEVSTDNGVTYSPFQTITHSDDVAWTSSEEYDLSAYAGEYIRIRITATRAGTSDDYYLGFDNFYVGQPITCEVPTALTASNITANTADLSWTSEGSTFDISWGAGAFDAEDGTIVSLANGGTLSGLAPQTAYQYYVRQNCGIGDFSLWAGPFSFTTLVAPASIPWMEGFTTTTMPTGWAQTGFTFGAPAGITNAPGGVEGNVIYKNLYGTGSNASGNFQTIRIGTVSSGDILSFIYKTHNYGSPYAPPAIDSGNFIVAISTDNGVNYTNIQTITNDGVSEGWQDFEYDLSSYEGEYVRIRISATRTAGDYYLAFDNFYVGQPITCEAPTALTASNITTNTADLSWTSEGSTFDISWGTGTFDAEDGTIVSLANGGTLSGLAPQTAYQYYVRQNCGIGDFSLWAGPFSFTTDCDPVISLDENFDSYTTGNIVPECWTRLAPTTSVGSQTITQTTPASGTRNIYQYAGSTSNPVIVVLPSFSNVNDGTHWLKFKARVGSGAPGALHVGYVTDATDYDSFVLIETLAITNTSYTADAEYTVEIPTSVPAGAKLAIKNAADGKSYYWDDVIWEEAPSCISPSALTVSNITTDTADLSWTSEGSTFDISWGAGAFDAEDGTIVSLANGGTLSGLTAQTTYQYYVRQNCGVGDVSLWVGPFGFTTACEAFDLPYSQDFEGVTTPSLPSCTSIETLNGNPWRTSSTAVTGMTGNKLNYPWHASGTADAWFYTPGLNLEAGKNYAISYKYGNNSTFYTESMKVAYGTSAMASVMNEVLADHNAINSTGVSENEVFFTVAEDGVYYFGFQSYSIANQNQLYVDDILIRELGDDCTGTPDAGIATASMSSGESGSAVDFAVTGYDNTAEGLSYDWEYSTDNGVTWHSTVTSDNEVTFTITGTIGTVFQVRYAATCSFSGLIGYSNIVTFTVALPLNYCTPTYTSFTYDDRLSAVTTTGAVLDLNYSNSTTISQHFDGTDMVLEAAPGQQFTLSTTYVGGDQTVGVWIDWENNNTFDDLGNRIALNYSTEDEQSFTVTIPSDATPGDYRLRVRGSWNNHTADGDIFACNSKSYGSSVDFTIRVAAPCSAEWTGAVSTDWNTAGNWCDNAVPTEGSDVVINVANPVIISTDVTVNSITLGSDASLTVNETLTVGNISVAVGGGFTVTYGAGLLQPETAVNTGDITVKVEAGTEWFGYNMFSSPVAGQTFADFSDDNGDEVFEYGYTDDVTGNWEDALGVSFVEGYGYLFAAPYDGFPLGELTTFYGEFTGVPNNGDVSVSVNADTYAALGNPYPSAIDADDFLAANSHIGTLYFWTNANFYDYYNSEYPGYNYATYTSLAGTGTSGDVTYEAPNGTIAVGQGFVAAVTGAGPVAFDNAMRIDASGTLYKALAQDKHRMWLNLNNSTNMLNQIVIGYMEGASMGVDNGIDGPMFDYDGSSLYSLIENSDVNYTIQGRYPFATSDVVPLGFKATTTDNYTISLVDFDGLFAEGQDIYLLDHFTTSLVNLKDTDYSFVSEPGVFDTRFEIVYNSTMSISNPTLDNSWVVYKQNGHLQILAEGFDMKQVVVIDMLGRTIYQATAEGRTHQLPELGANAVLIIKVISTDNQTSTKKVVH